MQSPVMQVLCAVVVSAGISGCSKARDYRDWIGGADAGVLPVPIRHVDPMLTRNAPGGVAQAKPFPVVPPAGLDAERISIHVGAVTVSGPALDVCRGVADTVVDTGVNVVVRETAPEFVQQTQTIDGEEPVLVEVEPAISDLVWQGGRIEALGHCAGDIRCGRGVVRSAVPAHLWWRAGCAAGLGTGCGFRARRGWPGCSGDVRGRKCGVWTGGRWLVGRGASV